MRRKADELREILKKIESENEDDDDMDDHVRWFGWGLFQLLKFETNRIQEKEKVGKLRRYQEKIQQYDFYKSEEVIKVCKRALNRLAKIYAEEDEEDEVICRCLPPLIRDPINRRYSAIGKTFKEFGNAISSAISQCCGRLCSSSKKQGQNGGKDYDEISMTENPQVMKGGKIEGELEEGTSIKIDDAEESKLVSAAAEQENQALNLQV